jgi:TATA-box binding protein (TBP) (component of TFIID and TFIIIB)
MIVQKFKKVENDSFSLAERYYTLLSAVNSLGLTEREIQLVAFTAIKGNISYANIREEFCKKYESSSATINNIISKLKKINVLVKDGGKVKVNNVIVLDFTKDITLEIKMIHG